MNNPNEPSQLKSDVEKAIDYWREEVIKDSPPHAANYKSNMLHEVWSPKWKWVRPLLGWIGFRKIVRWAYNIKSTLFTGVYPVAIKTGLEIDPDANGNFTLSFKGEMYVNEAIQREVDRLKGLNVHEGFYFLQEKDFQEINGEIVIPDWYQGDRAKIAKGIKEEIELLDRKIADLEDGVDKKTLIELRARLRNSLSSL